MSTYLEYYMEEICPKVRELDIFFRTEKEPYSRRSVAQVLNISYDSLEYMLMKSKLQVITKGVFFYLLNKVEPSFAVMLFREMEHSNKDLYSIEEIAHIYLIELEYIEEVAKIFGKDEFSKEELSLVFAEIGKK